MLAKTLLVQQLLRNIQVLRRLTHTESKAVVGGKSINYVRTGADGCSQEAVLLMPGALGSAWTDFGPQLKKLPALLPNWTIIAWDPPGYGRSIPPKRTFPVDFFQRDAQDANDLMLELGFSKYSVVGWSDGGITALVLGAKHPDAVEKLVVWGANAYVLPEEIQFYESMPQIAFIQNSLLSILLGNICNHF